MTTPMINPLAEGAPARHHVLRCTGRLRIAKAAGSPVSRHALCGLLEVALTSGHEDGGVQDGHDGREVLGRLVVQ
jgi:hypothetical protein